MLRVWVLALWPPSSCSVLPCVVFITCEQEIAVRVPCLDETAKEVLGKLTDCHAEYDGITAWESFRRGFALGARLVMEVVYGTEAQSEKTT